MPGMNGIETLRRIRAMDLHVPVYIVTAFQTEFFKDLRALSDDGIDFEIMKKPLESKQLVEVANAILKKS